MTKVRQEVTSTKGDATGTIDDLINFLNEAKAKGATNYSFRWSGDPFWAFKWFETYRVEEEKDVEFLLKENGWEIECESPFEIRHKDGSFATMKAAYSIVEELCKLKK
jgi:hypothetical protein